MKVYHGLSPTDDTDIDKLYSDFEQESLQGSQQLSLATSRRACLPGTELHQ